VHHLLLFTIKTAHHVHTITAIMTKEFIEIHIAILHSELGFGSEMLLIAVSIDSDMMIQSS